MKRRSSYVVLLVALLLGFNLAHGQDPRGPGRKKPRTPDDYKPRTLKEVAAKAADAEGRRNKEDTMVVHGDTLPSRAKVRYAGTARPLPQNKKEILRQWARLYAGFPEGYTEQYETELLFTEDGTEHWLAVRKRDLPKLEQLLQRDEAAELFLIRVGAAKSPGGWESVLLIESFQR